MKKALKSTGGGGAPAHAQRSACSWTRACIGPSLSCLVAPLSAVRRSDSAVRGVGRAMPEVEGNTESGNIARGHEAIEKFFQQDHQEGPKRVKPHELVTMAGATIGAYLLAVQRRM